MVTRARSGRESRVIAAAGITNGEIRSAAQRSTAAGRAAVPACARESVPTGVPIATGSRKDIAEERAHPLAVDAGRVIVGILLTTGMQVEASTERRIAAAPSAAACRCTAGRRCPAAAACRRTAAPLPAATAPCRVGRSACARRAATRRRVSGTATAAVVASCRVVTRTPRQDESANQPTLHEYPSQTRPAILHDRTAATNVPSHAHQDSGPTFPSDALDGPGAAKP